MREFLDAVQGLLATGEVDAAIGLCGAQPGAAQALGLATIALFRSDGAALHEHATRAFELEPSVEACKYLAISHILKGDGAAAIAVARRAVALDDTPETRAELGTILLTASRPYDALAVLRQSVFEQPSNHEARLHLAAASVQVGDHGEAISHYAQAFVAAPGDPRPIRSLLAMFADLGKWLGAGAALQLARTESAPSAEALVLDLVFVLIGQLISGTFPALGINPMADRGVQSLELACKAFAPPVQLAVAHTLVELGRGDAARRVVDAIVPTTDDERAARLIVEGELAEAAGEPARAVEYYADAQAAAAGRTDAVVKAITILRRDPDPAARQRIAALLARVPAEHRAADTALMVQEAAYLIDAGQPDDACALVERVARITRGAGPVAEAARALLVTIDRARAAAGADVARAS